MKNQYSPFENKEFADLFEKLRRPILRKVASELVEFSGIKPGQSLLDLGCGPGLIVQSILQRVRVTESVLIDSSPEMVRRARTALRTVPGHHVVKRVNLSREKLSQILRNRAFDHAIAIDLWHLLDERNALISDLRDSLLIDSGILTIFLHTELSSTGMREWHSIRREIRETIRSRILEHYPGFSFPPRTKGAIIHRNETEIFVRELEHAGFKLVRKEEKPELADINRQVKYFPGIFKLEVKRVLPRIRSKLLDVVVESSVREVIATNSAFGSRPFATEIFLAFEERI